MPQLEFTHVRTYPSDETGITIPTTLRAGANQVAVVASIDTGATFCLFAGEVAEELGIELIQGERRRFRTANSMLDTFGHQVEISTMGLTTFSTVYFFADPSIRKNVLGRIGWLDRVRLGVVDHDSLIYLAPYDVP